MAARKLPRLRRGQDVLLVENRGIAEVGDEIASEDAVLLAADIVQARHSLILVTGGGNGNGKLAAGVSRDRHKLQQVHGSAIEARRIDEVVSEVLIGYRVAQQARGAAGLTC